MIKVINKSYAPYVTVVFFAVLLTFWIIGFNHPPLPPDGVFYITIAKHYLERGIQGAFELFRWPFYPILIAMCSKLTGLSLVSTAYTIDTLGLILMGVMFIKLIEMLGGAQKHKWIGALLILTFPIVNRIHYSPILREFGYWGFVLLSVYQLLCYAEHKQIKNALFWTFAIFCGTLFRTEGALIWVFSPLVLFFQNESFSDNLRNAVKLVLPTVCGIACISIGLYGFHPEYFNKLSTFHHWVIEQKFGFSNIGRNVAAINQIYDNAVMFIRVTYEITRSFVSTFYGVFLVFIYFGLSALKKQNLALTSDTRERMYRGILWIYFAISVFCYYFFVYGTLDVFHKPVLPSRYVVMYAILLLVYAPFGMTALYERCYKQRHFKEPVRWILPSLIIVATLVAYHNIVRVGHIKHYLQQSGTWVKAHIPLKEKLYTNEVHILFYADRLAVRDLKTSSHAPPPTDKLLKHYHYFAVFFRRQEGERNQAWRENKQLKLLKSYALKTKGRVDIFKKKTAR